MARYRAFSRGYKVQLLHACSLVVEDASVDPVWLQLPGRSNQMPAMRWVQSAATIVSEKVQYTQADTPFMAGLTLAEFELLVPRGHVRYKQPGLPATTLHRHCRNERAPGTKGEAEFVQLGPEPETQVRTCSLQ
ncbi:VWA3A [Symbiodinium natans]|uniref:VWA3A protein n=1 Tax=Symbiodinium natans TaxID=878477 RepID=A0A812J914_9DINO|nr:VWA3A [Symbiodinium natans]